MKANDYLKVAEKINKTNFRKTISIPCTIEPQMGNCIWKYWDRHKGYLCSICGAEIIKIEVLNVWGIK